MVACDACVLLGDLNSVIQGLLIRECRKLSTSEEKEIETICIYYKNEKEWGRK